MTTILTLHLMAVVLAGLLAGMELAFHHGLRTPMLALRDEPQLELRKALVLRLRVMVPAFFAPVATFGIALTVLSGLASGVWFRALGVLGIALWVALRVVGTVPINRQSLTWETSNPPANWRQLVEHAERFHVLGVWAMVVTFVSFLMSLVSVGGLL